MKKNLKFLGGCLAIALALTACGHEHIPGAVTADQDNHTYTCIDCGKEISGAHKLDEDNWCVICGSSVYTQEDGSCNVTTYDENGNMKTDIFYDENGNVYDEVVYESEYDENGNEVTYKTFENGILTQETYYETIETEDLYAHYITQTIEYAEDGKTVTVYDDTVLNPKTVTVYDAADNVITQTTYEYVKDANDNVLGCVSYIDGVISEEYKGFMDAEDCFRYNYNKYYENGELAEVYNYEYDFNSEGLILGELEFYNGVLSRESRFAVNEHGWTYMISEVCYDEAGNATEVYSYDEEDSEI